MSNHRELQHFEVLVWTARTYSEPRHIAYTWQSRFWKVPSARMVRLHGYLRRVYLQRFGRRQGECYVILWGKRVFIPADRLLDDVRKDIRRYARS